MSIIVETLHRCEFKEAIDKNCIYSCDAPLYYKKIHENKYLVINSYNHKSKLFHGFDCWISEYDIDPLYIGIKQPLTNKIIKYNLNLGDLLSILDNYRILKLEDPE